MSAAKAVQSQADGYFDKVIKYIPGDVIAAWTTILGITGGVAITSGREEIVPSWLLWVLLVVFIAFTAWWTHNSLNLLQGVNRDQSPISSLTNH